MGKRGTKLKNLEIVWSAELAYAVGLIATDGCLYNNGRHLALVSKDVQQLRNLKKCLNLKVKIGKHQGRKGVSSDKNRRVQWGDVRFYGFLLEIGLTPNKSLTMGALEVPDNFFFDFLRGAFDGDGSFYSYFDPRWRASFMFYINFCSASSTHISWLRESIKRLAGIHGHVSRIPKSKQRNGFETLRYAKQEGLILIRRMYADPDAPSLTRKKLKINDALRIVGEHPIGADAQVA